MTGEGYKIAEQPGDSEKRARGQIAGERGSAFADLNPGNEPAPEARQRPENPLRLIGVRVKLESTADEKSSAEGKDIWTVENYIPEADAYRLTRVILSPERGRVDDERNIRREELEKIIAAK